MKKSGLFACALVAGSLLLHAQNKKILVVGMSPDAIQEFKSAATNATIRPVERDQLMSEVADADAILGTVNDELIRAGKKLKWVQTYSAGVFPYITPELQSSDITLTNCKIIQGPEIADHAMAMLLSLTRGLYQAIPNRTNESWERRQYRPVELNGKTAVVLGVGGIGMQIAVRARSFGMRVIGVDPKDIPYTPFVEKFVPPDQLDDVLPQADVVFVAAPLTQQSQGMMGARQFELMRKNSYFIAVSRGKIYDSDALVKALDSKHLAGAGLDVTNPEPLPKGHPLWKFENVIVTPHIAGQSDEIQSRRIALIKENIRRFAAGEPLLNVVDKQKGY